MVIGRLLRTEQQSPGSRTIQMRTVVSAAALLLFTGTALAGGLSAVIPARGIVGGSMIHEVATPPVRRDKKKKPAIKKPAPSNVGGSSSRNVGQGQSCLCTTNYKGGRTCTGNCR